MDTIEEEKYPDNVSSLSEESLQNQSLSTASNSTNTRSNQIHLMTSSHLQSETSSTTSNRPAYLIRSTKPSTTSASPPLPRSLPASVKPSQLTSHESPVDYEPIPQHLQPASILQRLADMKKRCAEAREVAECLLADKCPEMFMHGEDEYLNTDEDIVY